MKKARAIVLISFLLLALFVEVSRPRTAEAANLGIIIGASIGVFVGVTALGTWLVYGRKYEPDDSLVQVYSPQLAERDDSRGLRFAPTCKTLDGQVPLACW